MADKNNADMGVLKKVQDTSPIWLGASWMLGQSALM
jgi:hypothetical protein